MVETSFNPLSALVLLLVAIVAVVLDERTIRLDEEVAKRLGLKPGERLDVLVRDGEVILVRDTRSLRLVNALERLRGTYSGRTKREEWYEQASLY